MSEKKWFSFDLEEYSLADSQDIYKCILLEIDNPVSIMVRNRNISVWIRYINDKQILQKVEESLYRNSILNKDRCHKFLKHIETRDLSMFEATKIKAFFFSIEIVKTLYYYLYRIKGIKPPQVHYKIDKGNLYFDFNIEQLNVEYAQMVKESAEKVLTESELKSNQSKIDEQLTLKEIALFHIYENLNIPNEESANEIARKYGYKSGKKLKQTYDSLIKTSERIAFDSKRILNGRKKSIQNVIPHLSAENKEQARTELRVIESHLEKY